MALMNDNKKTHFGYKSVDPEDKTDLVGEVFTSVAHKYYLMNVIM
jgi:ubiquinone/menaquinone biosynthesis C-methylase UbiE